MLVERESIWNSRNCSTEHSANKVSAFFQPSDGFRAYLVVHMDDLHKFIGELLSAIFNKRDGLAE